MSEVFDSHSNQARVRRLLMVTNKIANAPYILDVLNARSLEQTWANREKIGWGMVEYRAGTDCLSSAPSRPGESPAEISYYPIVPEIGLHGAIYVHGEGSNALIKRQELAHVILAPTEVEYFGKGVIIKMAGGELDLTTSDNTPPLDLAVSELEAHLDNLYDYIASA